MKNRFLVRSIFVLLIAAILLWTILTALFYSYEMCIRDSYNRIAYPLVWGNLCPQIGRVSGDGDL